MANVHIEDLRMGDLFLFWADRVAEPGTFRIYVITSEHNTLGGFVYCRYYIGSQNRWMRSVDMLDQSAIHDPRVHYIGNCGVSSWELLEFVSGFNDRGK